MKFECKMGHDKYENCLARKFVGTWEIIVYEVCIHYQLLDGRVGFYKH